MIDVLNDESACPLCCGRALFLFFRDDWRTYLACETCSLVHVPLEFHLSFEDERAHYAHHENDPEDSRYCQFLSQLSDPLIGVLKKRPSRPVGLDFGCGPGPALSKIFADAGIKCYDYDPFFKNDAHVLKRTYDFVTLSEVAEHLVRPHEEFDRLWRMLKLGGWLAMLTSEYPDAPAFEQWYYRRDPTHICFYSPTTFKWLAQLFGAAQFLHPAKNVYLLQKA